MLAHPLAASFDLDFFLDFVFTPPEALLIGVLITVVTAVIAQTVGTVIGLFSALATLSRIAPVRYLAAGYVWLFRGLPTLVIIFLVYFGLPSVLGFDLFPTDSNLAGISVNGAIVAGTVALAINEGAYMSEIIRAGIQSVDSGQREAALSVGMTSRRSMRHIVMPQAARVIVPPLGNDFINMLKTTSLLSVIGVQELFRVAEGVNAETFKTFEAFLGAAVYYLALVTLFTFLQKRVENRLSVHLVTEQRSVHAHGSRAGTLPASPVGEHRA